MREATFEEVFTEAGIQTGILPKWVSRGEAKGKAEVARNLLAKGMPIEEIVQVTELPLEEIHALCG